VGQDASGDASQNARSDAQRLDHLADDLDRLGVRRLHTFSWRDLDDPDAGGSEVHHDQVFARWAARGLEIRHRSSTVVGPRELDRNGYHIVQRGSRYSVFPRAVAAEVFHRAGPRDAVVEIWNGVPWFSPVWHRGPQVTWLHHVHGPMWALELPRPLAAVGRFVERRLAPPWYRRRPVVTLAEASRQELVTLGFHPERVHVVPPGVDPRFHRTADDADAPRLPPTVVAVGRLAKVKRFDLVLVAVDEARRRHPDLRLVIVGEGPERAALEQWIRTHHAGDWATLAGRCSDAELVNLYLRSRVVISASLAEGWGMTITEAAGCGTPAVATDVIGHRGAVEHSVTGLLVPDAAQLGAALADLLASPTRLDALGAAARQRAERFTWDRTAADNLAVLVAAAKARTGQDT
jgi:glycosyltransferase involved in cell wall biosynthesis